MHTFKIKQPCALWFEINNAKPLLIDFNSGKRYHERKETGKILVNFPIVGTYKSNYNPVDGCGINGTFDRDFKPEKMKVVKGNFKTPVAYMSREKKCIYVCDGFEKIPYQQQIAILLHETAHITTDSENEADQIAHKNFLKLGFNESQFYFAIKNFASNCSERHKLFFNAMEKIK
jgi:hypothetical protein